MKAFNTKAEIASWVRQHRLSLEAFRQRLDQELPKPRQGVSASTESIAHQGGGMQRQQALPSEQRAIEREIQYGVFFRQACDWYAMAGVIDPVTPVIVNRVSRLAKLQTAVLALTLVRWSELSQIAPCMLAGGMKQRIVQPKTTLMRDVYLPAPLPSCYEPPQHLGVTCCRLGYNSLYAEIRKAVPREIKKVLVGSSDVCHIFRHLRASWYSRLGWQLGHIADALGQSTLWATPSYLHPELFPRKV